MVMFYWQCEYYYERPEYDLSEDGMSLIEVGVIQECLNKGECPYAALYCPARE